MPRRTRKKSSPKRRRKPAAVEVITERTQVITEPRVEIRKPATLAQALTEPAVAVVKPETRRTRTVRRTRRAA